VRDLTPRGDDGSRDTAVDEFLRVASAVAGIAPSTRRQAPPDAKPATTPKNLSPALDGATLVASVGTHLVDDGPQCPTSPTPSRVSWTRSSEPSEASSTLSLANHVDGQVDP